MSSLSRLRDLQMKIWNARCVEVWLVKHRQPCKAYNLRQVLDLLSPNWRGAITHLEVEIYQRFLR